MAWWFSIAFCMFTRGYLNTHHHPSSEELSGFGNDNRKHFTWLSNTLDTIISQHFTIFSIIFMIECIIHPFSLSFLFLIIIVLLWLFRPFFNICSRVLHHMFPMLPPHDPMIPWSNYVLGQPLLDTTPLLKSFKSSMVKLVHSPAQKQVVLADI